MKKIFIVIFGLILVGIFGYYGWSWNVSKENQLIKPGDTNSDSIVQISGVLTRNNPGLEAGVWFLIADLPGSPASRFRLSFDVGSECLIGSRSFDCDKMDLPNGTRVRINASRADEILFIKDLTAEENSDLITVDNIAEGDKIVSPFNVVGKARGNWFFEASFPIFVKDLLGNSITTTIATAQSEWMTTDFVPFLSKLEFNVVVETPAEIILAADNPSGLPQYDRDIRFKVTLMPGPNVREVSLFYYDPKKDLDDVGNIMCSDKGLVEVKRRLVNSDQIIYETVKLLLEGQITATEKSNGVTSEFPLSEVKLNSTTVANGVATVNISDPENKTTGGSCRVGILWRQIEKTVKQFPGITEVKFSPEFLFQP